jgi:hypothetical protein
VDNPGNNAPRKKIILNQVDPGTWSGDVILTRSSAKVNVFTASTGGTQLLFDGVDNRYANSSLPKTLWVEGYVKSSSSRDVGLTLEAMYTLCTDQVKFTVLWLVVTTDHTGSLESDNSARDNLASLVVPPDPPACYAMGHHLYRRCFPLAPEAAWNGRGSEFMGTVCPSDFMPGEFSGAAFPLHLAREVVNGKRFTGPNGDVLLKSFSLTPDTGEPWARDDHPQSGTSEGVIYDDDATEIELSETGANSGIFESDSLMLMSDDVDDDHQVDAIADDVEKDRTHKVAIEGKVQLQYPASGCGNWKKEADVPKPSDVKTVNVHVVILKNGSTVLIGERFKDENDNGVRDGGETYRDTDSSSSYTSNLSESDATKRVEEEFEVAKQRYAQVGVKLNLTIDFEQAPAAINDGLIELSLTSPDGDNDLSDDEKSLFQAGLNSTSRVDIEAYYVAKATRTQGSDFSRSTACPSDWYENMTTTDLNDSIIVTNKAGYYDPAHELYHIFSQKTAHFGGATNLFDDFCTYIVLESGASPTDSKRLDTTQESTIRNSEYAQ